MSKIYQEFYIKDCPEKAEVVQQIVQHGGVVTKIPQQGVIHLAPLSPQTDLTALDYRYQLFSTKYIFDCIQEVEVLDIEGYKMIQNKVKCQKKGSNRGGRNNYTKEQDEIILTWVQQHLGCSSSLAYWTQAINQGLNLDHSAESLKYHYNKVLKPKLLNLGIQKKVPVPTQKAKEDPIQEFFIKKSKLRQRASFLAQNNELTAYQKLQTKYDTQEVIQQFQSLMKYAQKFINPEITQQQLLDALDTNQGNVEATIKSLRLI